MPFTMEVNDMPLYVRYGNEPAAFTAVLRRLLDGWTQPHNPPGCLDVTVHAHVFGRPFGAIELQSALDLVKHDFNPAPDTPASISRGFFSSVFGGASVSMKANFQRRGVHL